jgi:initiation factor 1A
MPKNTQGGTGHKKLAHKNCSNSKNNRTRKSENEYEYYAQVTAMLGGKECQVRCQDGTLRLCHIRGKFSGKGKRDNILYKNAWVLVGLREFETKHDDAGQVNTTTGKLNKLDKCDLLEIYNDRDKEYLKSEISAQLWSCFIDDDIKLEEDSTSIKHKIVFNDEDMNMNKITEEMINGLGVAISFNNDAEEEKEVDICDI